MAGTPDLHTTAHLGHPKQGPTAASDLEGALLKGAQAGGRASALLPSPEVQPLGSPRPLGPRPSCPCGIRPLPAPRAPACSFPPGSPVARARKETFFMLCLFPSRLSAAQTEIYSPPLARGIRGRGRPGRR